MTEREWLAGDDPAAMLAWLTEGRHWHDEFDDLVRGGDRLACCSDRKLRLFAAAVSRLGCPNGAGDSSLGIAQSWAEAVADDPGLPRPEPYFWWVAHADPREAARQATASGSMSIGIRGPANVAALLREVFGNPWRPVRLAVCPCGGDYCTNPTCNYPDPDCITPAVRALAESIDATRDFARLPELAEALEAAGCRDQELLMHLRGKERCFNCVPPDGEPWGIVIGSGPAECGVCRGAGWIDLRGPHVRGCWALFRVLGKE